MARKKTIFNNVSVTPINENTGNHCINVDQLINGKDFKFNFGFGDNSYYYILTPQQVMDYIANNKCKAFKHIEAIDDETGEIKNYYCSFYLIKDDYIKEVGKIA